MLILKLFTNVHIAFIEEQIYWGHYSNILEIPSLLEFENHPGTSVFYKDCNLQLLKLPSKIRGTPGDIYT